MIIEVKAEVFRGLTNPDVNIKRMHQLFCYMTDNSDKIDIDRSLTLVRLCVV